MVEMIKYYTTLGDSPVWEIVAGLFFVACFFAISFAELSKRGKDHVERQFYPRLCEVAKADADQLEEWLKSLPEAKTKRELDVISLIIERSWNNVLKEADELHAAKRYQVTHELEETLQN